MRLPDRHIKKPEDSGEHFLRSGNNPDDKHREPLAPGEVLDYQADPEGDPRDTIEGE